MFNSREVAERALTRAGILMAWRKRKCELLVVAMLLCGVCALTLCFSALPVVQTGTDLPTHASATALDGASTGGYVLAGVIGFALGVVLTVFCVKRAKMQTTPQKNHADYNV